MIQRIRELNTILNSIYHLNACGKDPQKVKRGIDTINIDADIMIIAEAIAPSQVRLSGINYFHSNSKIGNTGRNLERFLNKIGYTVYPNKAGTIYHTEIVHSFPGYEVRNGKKSIKRPNKSEILRSLESGILNDEIDLIKPKLIFLMGSTSYLSFYKYFLNFKDISNLTNKIKNIVSTKVYDMYKQIPIIPIQHASGANPRFHKMAKNEELIKLIQDILK